MVNHLRTYHVIIPVFLLFFSCGKKIVSSEPETELSLPRIELEIEHEEYMGLINGTYSNDYYPGKFKFENRTQETAIRIQGNITRRDYKKSYKLKFPTDNLFEDNAENLVISAQMADHTFMRSILSLLLFKKAGLKTVNYKPAGLFINGEFKGIYLMLESLDEFFFYNRGIPPGNLYEAFRNDAEFSFGGGYNVRSGFKKNINDNDNFSDLEDLIYIIDTAAENEFKTEIEKVLNIENVIGYLTVFVLISNFDGFFNNFHLFNNPVTGKFEFIPWDLDKTFGLEVSYNQMGIRAESCAGENKLINRLLNVPEYKDMYIEMLTKYLDEEFSRESLQDIVFQLYGQIKDDYYLDPIVGIKGYDLEKEIEYLFEYVQLRADYLRSQLGTIVTSTK